jgi:phage baseplate assembly protein V
MRDAVANMLRRALIVAVNDAGDQQLLSLTAFLGEQLPNIVRVESFGLASNPPPGGEGVLFNLGGRSDRGMFFGGEHPRFRPTNLPAGGTMLYDAFGQAVSFVQNNVRIVGTKTITIQAPNIILMGEVFAGAQVGATPVKLDSGAAATNLNAI